MDNNTSIDSGSIGDLSDNKFAAAMRELANGLAGWSSILLLIFYLWLIGTNDQAHFLSIKALLLVVLGEFVFVVLSKVANLLFAAFITFLALPFALKGKTRETQNVQNSILALFGLGLCIGAWFFAKYSFEYTYSGVTL